jgi:hypothetical protein
MEPGVQERNKDFAGIPRVIGKNFRTHVLINGLIRVFSGESSTPFDGTIKFD